MPPAEARPALDKQVYELSVVGWHLGFGLFVALTATILLGSSTGESDQLVVALGLLAVVACSYVLSGARAMREPFPARAGGQYLVIAGPLILALFGVTPVGSTMLFVLFPQIWRLLPTRRAVAATTAAIAVIAGLTVAKSTGPVESLLPTLGWLGGSLLVAILLGLWITRIADLSEQRAVLLTELETSRAELAAMSHDAGVLAERARLASEVHDTLAQGFTSILLLVQVIDEELGRDPQGCRPHLRLLEQHARENLTESRALVAAGAPAQLETAPLPAALRRLVDRLGQELGIPARTEVVGSERALPPSHDVVLLRVTQEALANVRKHAGADRLGLRLTYGPDAVRLEVTDDGCGFCPRSSPGGFGLGGMRRRVEEIGGRLAVQAAPGAGATVSVELDAPQCS